MGKRAKGLYRQLTISQRRILEASLNDGLTLTRAAARMGVAVSTVRRELLRNRRHDGTSKSANRDKNDCAFLKSCKVKNCCDRKGCRRLCRACPAPCERLCSEYVPKLCETTEKAPFVCNACVRYSMCTLDRWKYSAESAQKMADGRASSARKGIDLTDDQVSLMVDKVKAGRSKGQSIHHIFTTEQMPCSERTFYRYVDEGLIPIIALDLAKKVRYRSRRKKRAAPSAHEKGFYKGCEYADFLELPPDERARATEVDTVLGARGDRRCILSLHRVDLHFQLYILLPDKTASSVVRALDWVEMSCEGAFSDLFGLALFDRGSEFDAIEDMEASYLHAGKRLDAYFTDPSRPDQKGRCEKNHVELRKVLPKGTSFEKLDSATLAEICCHVNSTVRKGCGNASPMQLAQMVFPKEVMENLGLSAIPPRDVISAPGMLYDPKQVD